MKMLYVVLLKSWGRMDAAFLGVIVVIWTSS